MNFRIASLLLATTITAVTATANNSKAFRIFDLPRAKAGKVAFHLTSVSASEDLCLSTSLSIPSKSSKILALPSSLSISSKAAKSYISSKAAKKTGESKDHFDDDAPLYSSKSSKGGKSVKSKAGVSKAAKSTEPTKVSTDYPTLFPTNDPTKLPTDDPTASPSSHPTSGPSASPSAQPSLTPTLMPTKSPTDHPTLEPTLSPTVQPTLMPTKIPTYHPTLEPTLSPTVQPTTRRPTQQTVCESGDFVDSQERTCFWYIPENVEQGCESLRDQSTDVDLTNGDGKTPWDECCFCGGGYQVPV